MLVIIFLDFLNILANFSFATSEMVPYYLCKNGIYNLLLEWPKKLRLGKLGHFRKALKIHGIIA